MNGTVGKRNPPAPILDEARDAAHQAIAALKGPDGRLVEKSYDHLNDGLPADLRAWLLELPSFLAKKGRRGEGDALCAAYGELFAAGYLDAERAVVAWEAGERDAGKAALDAALAAWPAHCWPELRSGYVLEQEGLLDRAQASYERAVEKARAGGNKKDLRFCWDGLVQFWHNKGDRGRAVELSRQMLKECPDLEEELRVETLHAPQKVGRNDPCPCGSGKKHKKCCA